MMTDSEKQLQRARLRLVSNDSQRLQGSEPAEPAKDNVSVESAALEAAHSAVTPDYDESMVKVLAAKILVDWLRNRQQLLVPFKLDLQRLDASQIDTLLQVMIAAVQADGSAPDTEHPRLKAALRTINADGAQRAALERVIADQQPLRQVLEQVADLQQAALVYAASVIAIDRRKLVNRQYLRYLAARLQLPRDLARALEQRYAASS